MPKFPVLTVCLGALLVVGHADYLKKYPKLEDMLKFIPQTGPWRCSDQRYSPAIDYTKGYTRAEWHWDESEPDKLLDKTSGAKFPDRSFQTERVELTSQTGKSVKYTFIWNKFSDQRFTDYGGIWIDGCLSAEQTKFLNRVLDQLVKSYRADDPATEKYARRTLEIYDAWTDAYSMYVYRAQNKARFYSPSDCQDRYCDLMSPWNGMGHELDWFPWSQFAKVRISRSVKALSTEKGYDVSDKIFNGFLKRQADNFVTKPVGYFLYTNLLGFVAKLAEMGQAIGYSRCTEFVYEYLMGVVGQAGKDGMVMESFMYGFNVMGGVRKGIQAVQRALKDDPSKLLALDKLNDVIVRGVQGLYNVQQPNDQFPANGDNTRRGFPVDESGRAEVSTHRGDRELIVAQRSGNAAMLPSYGHVALRGHHGPQAAQVQLELTSSAGYHHIASAANSIQLTAFGRTLHDHFRYDRSMLRSRNSYTGAWNTVVIDYKNQGVGARDRAPLPYHHPGPGTVDWMARGADVVLFEPAAKGFSITESDGYRAYYPLTKPGGYSRLLIHSTEEPEHPYTVDIFRVAGGAHHEYALHGDTMMHQDQITSFHVNPSTDPVQPSGDLRYKFYHNALKARAPTQTFTATLRGKCDGTEWPRCGKNESAPETVIWGVPGSPGETFDEIIMAESPHNYREKPLWKQKGGVKDPTKGPYWRSTFLERRSSGTNVPSYNLVKNSVECKSGDDDMGTKTSVQECADAVEAAGGTFFIYGKNSKSKSCYKENTASADCPEGWENDDYDFYSLSSKTPLESLFVHVLEPHRSVGAANSGGAIRSVERIPLREEDGSSVGLSIKRRDGRRDVILARMTPPTEGYEAKLPLVQPQLQPVIAADGQYSLRGHVGILAQSSKGAVTARVLVGGQALTHIDGTPVHGRAGMIYEGEVESLEVEPDSQFSHFFVTDSDLPEGTELSGRWMSLSLGSHRTSKLNLGHMSQNDVREMFEIAHIEHRQRDGKTLIRLVNDPMMVMSSDMKNVLVERLRPGRHFLGPARRSFRIVTTAVDIGLPATTTSTTSPTITPTTKPIQTTSAQTGTTTTSPAQTGTMTSSTVYELKIQIRDAGGQGCLKSRGSRKLLERGATSDCATFEVEGLQFRSLDVRGHCLDYFRKDRGWGLWSCHGNSNQKLQQKHAMWCYGPHCVEEATAATTSLAPSTSSTASSSTSSMSTVISTTTTLPVSAELVESGDTIFLRTRSGNWNYVSVEGTSLFAHSQSQGIHQAMTIEKTGGGALHAGDVVYLKAHTGFHVDAVDGTVSARWPDHGSWQAMVIEKRTGDSSEIMAGDIVCLLSANTGKHLDAGGDVIRARWHDCGDWQAMKVEKEPEGALFSGDSITLLAHTGKRIETDFSCSVRAQWSEKGLWQTFTIENYGGRVIFSGDPVFLKAHTGKFVHIEGSAVVAKWNEYGDWQRFTIHKSNGKGPVMPGDIIFLRAHTGKFIDVSGIEVQARFFEEGLWQSLTVEKKPSIRRLSKSLQETTEYTSPEFGKEQQDASRDFFV